MSKLGSLSTVTTEKTCVFQFELLSRLTKRNRSARALSSGRVHNRTMKAAEGRVGAATGAGGCAGVDARPEVAGVEARIGVPVRLGFVLWEVGIGSQIDPAMNWDEFVLLNS